MRKRKGIYQAFDARGRVTADERWQVLLLDDGSRRVEAEITRIAPFAEPRIESLSAQLGAELEWQEFAIYTRPGHTCPGRREAGVKFESERIQVCWGEAGHPQQREFAWRCEDEIGYNSPLLSMMTLWRGHLVEGGCRSFDAIILDAIDFQPRRSRQACAHLGLERYATRFGAVRLERYALSGGDGQAILAQVWCDRDGVIYEYAAADGSGYRLYAVNLTLGQDAPSFSD